MCVCGGQVVGVPDHMPIYTCAHVCVCVCVCVCTGKNGLCVPGMYSELIRSTSQLLRGIRSSSVISGLVGNQHLAHR